MSNDILYEAHPKMFKNNPIGFIFCILLIIAYGLGLLILFIWWLKCRNEKLTVTSEKVIRRTGILSKNTNEVYISDIRNIQVRQNLQQRMFNVGTIAIATAGTGGTEIVMKGIPDTEKVKDIIEEQRRAVA